MSSRNPLAYVLWAIVAVGLLFGVSQTVIKAADLFTETGVVSTE